MNDKVKPEISKYMAGLNAKRKNKKGGFSDPEVVKRAVETRAKNRVLSKLQQVRSEEAGEERQQV